jgi:hypothetical protein
VPSSAPTAIPIPLQSHRWRTTSWADQSAHRVGPAQSAGPNPRAFVYQDIRVHPHLFRSELGREAGVIEYQVRQTPAGAAIAVRCTAPVSLGGLRDRVAAALAQAGLERPQVTVGEVDRIERPGGPAKLKRFIPLPANPDASRQASPALGPAAVVTAGR